MELEILRELLDARDALSDIIIKETPGTNGVTKADFDALVSRRDRLTVAVNRLIGSGFKPNSDLVGAADQLKKVTNDLVKASEAVSGVKTAIDIAGQVLQTLDQIVAFFV